VSLVAALFVRSDTVYKALPGVDVWDAERDARLWPGGTPVVAHPPCAQWCRLRAFATPNPETMSLAPLAVELVRKWGGVLEHPAQSALWPHSQLPPPGHSDRWGRTIGVSQRWWGHQAEKKTWLYCVGVTIPALPFAMGQADRVVGSVIPARDRDRLSPAESEATPLAFAEWLIRTAVTASA
jgi:hypothetical protein